EKKEKGGRGRGGGKVLGEHPEGGSVTLRAGRFGPYVTHGKINATIPKSRDAESITLDEAVSLIAAKAENGTGKPAKKKAAAKKAPAKKAPAGKATAKKKTAKKPAAAKPVTKKRAEADAPN